MSFMMPPDLYERYVQNPVGWDHVVRQQLNLPDNRYYTVAVWPTDRAGLVTVDRSRVRVVHAKKVSKSDQS